MDVKQFYGNKITIAEHVNDVIEWIKSDYPEQESKIHIENVCNTTMTIKSIDGDICECEANGYIYQFPAKYLWMLNWAARNTPEWTELHTGIKQNMSATIINSVSEKEFATYIGNAYLASNLYSKSYCYFEIKEICIDEGYTQMEICIFDDLPRTCIIPTYWIIPQSGFDYGSRVHIKSNITKKDINSNLRIGKGWAEEIINKKLYDTLRVKELFNYYGQKYVALYVCQNGVKQSKSDFFHCQ